MATATAIAGILAIMPDPAPSAAALPDFDSECFRGAKLVEEGKLHEGAEVFRALSERADLGEGTRCVMAVNLATVYDKMGHTSSEPNRRSPLRVPSSRRTI